METTMDWNAVRHQFPHARHQTYVNHAAAGPLSRPVKEAIESMVAERHGARSDGSVNDFERYLSIWSAARERAADLLHTDSDRVAFAPNTSAALNVLARGLDWQPGDRVAVPSCEFPANVYPYMNLEDQGVAVDFIPHEEGVFSVGDVEATLTPDTRVLSLSWVQFLSGYRADLEAIGALCETRDVILCVDAIQGLGALQLDVEAYGIDFLACGGHKWLMAPQGIGLLYCADALRERLHPPAGWLHGPIDWDHFFDYDLAFHDDARQFEPGTYNNLGIVGLNAALKLREDVGPERCEMQTLTRARELAEGLDAMGYARYGTHDPAYASGIVTIHADDPDGLIDHLEEHDVTAAMRNRLVRFSPAYYNTENEMQRILDVVDAFRRASVTP